MIELTGRTGGRWFDHSGMTMAPRSVSKLFSVLLTSLLASTALTHVAIAQQAAVALSPVQSQMLDRLKPELLREGQRYEATLKTNWKAIAAGGATAAKKTREVTNAAAKVVVSDPRGAVRALSEAVVSDPADALAWIALAEANLAIVPDPNTGSERYELPRLAAAAAYLGYDRAKTLSLRAQALAALAEAMKRRSQWRTAIDVLDASITLDDKPATRAALDKLRAEHAFRMVDYKIENDAAQPRLCLQFSESLSRRQADFAKFITVDGKEPATVVVEGKQACLDGLAHGRRYEVQVRAGLPSDTAEVLSKASELGVYVKDRTPSVRFAGRSYVLPSRGQQGIPLVTVNTESVAVEIYRVGDRNLAQTLINGDFQKQMAGHDLETVKERTGAKVYSGVLEVASKGNEDVTTAVPVGDAIPGLKPGVYAMVAATGAKGNRDNYDAKATQWFIVSDLGLTAFTGSDGIHGFVRSLASANPASGATVRLIARNNEILGTAKTDTNGYVKFDAGLKRGEGGMAPAILVAEIAGSGDANAGGDYAFLHLSAAAFDLSDRGVKGRDATGPLDGFVYTERGVYRPGENVFLNALVRDAAGRAATVPMTLIIARPDGVEHKRIAMTDQGLGGRQTTLALGAASMTGTWKARLHADPKADPLAQVAFLVEDFVPERLDLKLEALSKTLAPEDVGKIALTGRYLYGPPAANLAVEGEIVVKPSTKDVSGFPGYQFGQADEKITLVRKPLEALPATDAAGLATLPVSLPPITRTARPLEADVILRLREPGGRTIERTVQLPVDPKMIRVGIKPQFKNGEAPENELAGFEAILVGADGKRTADQAMTWTLYKLEQSWQWYKRDGQWTYDAQTLSRKIASGIAASSIEQTAQIAAKVEWGRYRLEVAGSDGSGAVSSVNFRAGWHAEDAADSPELLEVALDRASYKPGETAKLKIISKAGGKALVSVMNAGLLSQQQIDVPKGGGEVAVKVDASWGAGAYVTAMVYRPMDTAAKHMPARALGIKWIGIDQTPRTLKIGIEAPSQVKSGAKLTVPIKLDGLAAGEEARITLAAVDAGILNLTRFQPPAPEGWFYAQRRLGVEIRDFYGRLIDGMRADKGRLRSGGDSAGGLAMNGSPPVEQLVAMHSGIVKVGADGRASIDFQLPEFNGTVRLTAVAWSADKLGHANVDTIVRDPVALTASTPRFMTLGDEARIELDVHNVEGPAAAYKVAVEQETAAGIKSNLTGRDVQLAVNERRREKIMVKPTEVGRMTYDVRVTGPNGIDVKRRLTFDVKVPAGDIRRLTTTTLAAGAKLTISPDIAADLIASRTKVSVSVGPVASFDVAGLLTQLDRYPYGCAEQTVSRALPLISANQLSVLAGLGADGALKERVQAAIERVLEMQEASGAFGIWGPRQGDLWLTAYVTDFLTRAKEAGYVVKPLAFTQALDRLQNYTSYAQDFDKGGEARAYALYVLARNGRAPIGDLRYYIDTRLERFTTALGKAHLGAAIAMLGDKERAGKAFRAALGDMGDKSANAARVDYGSSLRDGAALVTLAAETSMLKEEVPSLAGVLARTYATRTYTSTQEQAWMLLAAKALSDQTKDTTLTVNGQPHKGAFSRALTAAEIRQGQLMISNTGDTDTQAVISVIGAALTPEPAISKGFRLERSFYSLDGKKLDLKSVKQSDRMVVVLKLEALDAGGRVMLVDRLPAGLEIENPRLVDGGDIKTLEWLKGSIKPEHTDFRDDRFVAAFNLFSKAQMNGARAAEGEDDNEGETEGENVGAAAAAKTKAPANSANVAYIVRAVTPGSFVHPAATVEDMYRPDRFARTAAGRLDVTGKD
jgi:alpha-2-macroglobulin